MEHQHAAAAVILIGAPGSGKGTQGRILADRLSIPLISTGDLLRTEVASGSALGASLQKILATGKLVSDGLVNQMVRARLTNPDCDNGFLLDGYPRSVPQAKYLNALLQQAGLPAPSVLHLRVPIDELTRRLAGRRTCLKCGLPFHVSKLTSNLCPNDANELVIRPDDRIETVKARLESYARYEAALVRFYSGCGTYRTVEAVGALEEVAERMLAAIGQPSLAAA